VSLLRISAAMAGGEIGLSFDRHAKRQVLPHAAAARLDQDRSGDARVKPRHHLAHRRRKHVHAAHDQHVVGAAGCSARARRCSADAPRAPDLHVVPAPKPQQRSGFALQVRVHEFSRFSIGKLFRFGCVWIDQLDVDELPAEKCIPACAGHSPQSDAATSPMPMIS
jgi:hypothetical protein